MPSTTAPRLYALTLVAGDVYLGKPASIGGTVKFDDVDGNVVTLALRLARPDQSTLAEAVLTPAGLAGLTTGTLPFQLDFTADDDGIHQLELWAEDASGEPSAHLLQSLTVKISPTAPKIRNVDLHGARGYVDIARVLPIDFDFEDADANVSTSTRACSPPRARPRSTPASRCRPRAASPPGRRRSRSPSPPPSPAATRSRPGSPTARARPRRATSRPSTRPCRRRPDPRRWASPWPPRATSRASLRPSRARSAGRISTATSTPWSCASRARTARRSPRVEAALTPGATSGTAPFSVELTPDAIGGHTLAVWLVDAADQPSATRTQTLDVKESATAPRLTALDVPSGAKAWVDVPTPLPLELTFTDSDGNVVALHTRVTSPAGSVLVDVDLPLPDAAGLGAGELAVALPITAPAAGRHTLEAWLVDGAGERSRSTTRTFDAVVASTTAPGVSGLVAPTPTLYAGLPGTVSGSVAWSDIDANAASLVVTFTRLGGDEVARQVTPLGAPSGAVEGDADFELAVVPVRAGLHELAVWVETPTVSLAPPHQDDGRRAEPERARRLRPHAHRPARLRRHRHGAAGRPRLHRQRRQRRRAGRACRRPGRRHRARRRAARARRRRRHLRHARARGAFHRRRRRAPHARGVARRRGRRALADAVLDLRRDGADDDRAARLRPRGHGGERRRRQARIALGQRALRGRRRQRDDLAPAPAPPRRLAPQRDLDRHPGSGRRHDRRAHLQPDVHARHRRLPRLELWLEDGDGQASTRLSSGVQVTTSPTAPALSGLDLGASRALVDIASNIAGSVDFSDSDHNIQTLHLTILEPGGAVALATTRTVTSAATSGELTFTASFTATVEGRHTLQARLVDALGETSPTLTRTFDALRTNTTPSVTSFTVEVPAQIFVREEALVPGALVWSDADMNVATLATRVTRPNGTVLVERQTPAGVSGQGAGTLALEVSFTPDAPGNHKIEAWLVDAAGQASTKLSRTVTVLDTRPMVKRLSVINEPLFVGKASTVSGTVELTDADGDPAMVKLQLVRPDGTTWPEVEVAVDAGLGLVQAVVPFTFEVTPDVKGTHTLRAWVVDGEAQASAHATWPLSVGDTQNVSSACAALALDCTDLGLCYDVGSTTCDYFESHLLEPPDLCDTIGTTGTQAMCVSSTTDPTSPLLTDENRCKFVQYWSYPTDLPIDCRCPEARFDQRCMRPYFTSQQTTFGAGPRIRTLAATIQAWGGLVEGASGSCR